MVWSIGIPPRIFWFCLLHLTLHARSRPALQPIQLRRAGHFTHFTENTSSMSMPRAKQFLPLVYLGMLARSGSCEDVCGAEACPGSVSGRSLLQVDKALQLHQKADVTTATTTWASPYYTMSCPSTQAITTQSMTGAEYDNITAAVTALYDSLPSSLSRT